MDTRFHVFEKNRPSRSEFPPNSIFLWENGFFIQHKRSQFVVDFSESFDVTFAFKNSCFTSRAIVGQFNDSLSPNPFLILLSSNYFLFPELSDYRSFDLLKHLMHFETKLAYSINLFSSKMPNWKVEKVHIFCETERKQKFSKGLLKPTTFRLRFIGNRGCLFSDMYETVIEAVLKTNYFLQMPSLKSR